jgi:hypothetical protein
MLFRYVRWIILGTIASCPLRAFASFHEMQIEQVIAGVNGDTTAQAIQLRMRNHHQNFVSEARIRAWDAAGANPVMVIDMTDDVNMSDAGDRVLIATPSFVASTTPNAVPDFLMTNPIPASYLAAGSLTFEDDFGTIWWRLSWGGSGYTGSTTGNTLNDTDPGNPANFGPAFPDPLPSTTLQALRFTGEPGDRSTSNDQDYALTDGAAVFTNNARVDFTVAAPQPIVGDIDGDGDVDIDDHALCIGCLAGPDDPLAPVGCAPEDFAACDLEGDTDVDLFDFADFYLLSGL